MKLTSRIILIKSLHLLLKTIKVIFKYSLLTIFSAPEEKKLTADEEYLEYLRTVKRQPIP